MIFRAIEFAARAHSGCYRKVSHIPYINHPLGVARILIDFGFDEQPLAVAAVLHDTVEGGLSIGQIRNEFGNEVAFLVDSVSGQDKFATWHQRKVWRLRHLETAPVEALFLSCADKLDNLQSIRSDLRRFGETVWHFFNADKNDQCWYYTSLSHLFSRRLAETKGQPLAAELKTHVHQIFDLFDRGEEDE